MYSQVLRTALLPQPGTMPEKNHHILVVDDNEAIHNDFRKILRSNEEEAKFEAKSAELFNEPRSKRQIPRFELDFAFQGQDALRCVQSAVEAGNRYAVVFMDVRMPPGWDGLETTLKLWEADPDLQIVLCTAYSDYSWEEIAEMTVTPERMLILKKPFDAVEVLQLAHALTEKWSLLQAARQSAEALEATVKMRTRELQTANAHLDAEIAEHRKFEQALQKSEALFRTISEASPLGIVLIDENADVIYANEAQRRIWGISSVDEAGFDWRGMVHPEDHERVLGEWRELRDTRIPFRTECRYVRKDGAIIWVSISAAAVLYGESLPASFVGVVEDITERKRIENSLQQSEQLFRTISETSPLGIVLCDENAGLIYTNEAHQRICGRTLAELHGTGWQDMLYAQDRERVISEWEEIKRTRKSFRSERRYTHKDGKIIWVSVNFAPMLNKGTQDAVRGYVGTVEDITDRKRMEEQVLRAQRMESIGTLGSGLAHDLNNILAPIMMSIEMLHGDTPADLREITLTTIAECAARGADIVAQVLTFARGSAQNEYSVLQVRHLAKEVEKIAKQTFPKSITVANHMPGNLWPVSGDSSQIHQILMNLCINARDAMPAGGTLTISGENIELEEDQANIHPAAKPGRYTLIEVMDTGEGIPQSVVHRIFDPFFTTKEVGKGTGLGLSTVSGIARGHGGFVNVYSEVGKGSTFKVYLPSAVNGESADARKEASAIVDGAGETILLVDDEASILTITGETLKMHGYNVLTAFNGIEAISLYVRHSATIQVLITDVMMPVMDGVSLVRALKKMNPALKIISATGQAEESRQAELRVLGVNAFLKKPISAGKLLGVVHDMIHTHKVGEMPDDENESHPVIAECAANGANMQAFHEKQLQTPAA
jgi:PAS domain S-box-containing protein